MILADSSVWIDHLRGSEPGLAGLLNRQLVLCHPYVIGEIACGSSRNRAGLLRDLLSLPTAVVAGDDEVLRLIDRHELMGSGIGYLDAHLLASAALTSGASLWTHDKRLAAAAGKVGVAI